MNVRGERALLGGFGVHQDEPMGLAHNAQTQPTEKGATHVVHLHGREVPPVVVVQHGAPHGRPLLDAGALQQRR